MGWLPISFGFPAILFGLLALPVIWWLLRLTPPKPQTETFPPLRILARVMRKEETPHQSPWWLTLLRLLMAALVAAVHLRRWTIRCSSTHWKSWACSATTVSCYQS